jgi:DnaK suppressor protein
MLTKKKQEYFKKLLDGRLDTLLSEANKTVTGMTSRKENLPDPADRASRDRERKLIGKIKEALERIENKTYGMCEECGEQISEARLKARPVTTLCIDCKKRQELDEKVKGL